MKPLTMLNSFGCALVAIAIFAGLPVMAKEKKQKKPNVVFILADNVGYGDMGPYGGGELRGAPTPNIDRLAREGLRFTQFLVEPACTPSSRRWPPRQSTTKVRPLMSASRSA